ELNVNSLELMIYQGPLCTAFMFIVAVYFDYFSVSSPSQQSFFQSLFINAQQSGKEHIIFSFWFYVILSSIVSFTLNLTAFLIIGKTSPITFQVFGHVKTISLI